jgi:hypothetical protein
MRPSGFGIVSIPFDAISHYCDEHGLSGSDRIIFRRVIRNLDNAFCSTIRKKEKAAAK